MKRFVLLIILTLTFTACSGAGASQTQPAGDAAAYTASAATIVAQLTEAAQSVQGATQAAATGAATDVAGPATETLPATSTPEPTNTPLPSDTPAPTATLAPTMTITPTLASAASELGEPVFKDTFDQAGDWPFYNSYYVEMNIQKGRLNMTARIPSVRSPRDNWMVTDTSLDDFYIEATVTPHACERGDRYGIIFRAPADASKGYLFGVSCDGHFALRVWDGSQSLSLVPWTPSAHILRGAEQPNTLGVKAIGEQITLFVNGKELITVTDDTFLSGAFGPFVGALHTPNFTVSFEEMTAWDLKK